MVDTSLHTPVLLERTVELLAPALTKPGAVLVDATLGMGGHAEAFLSRFPNLVLVGIDRDREALGLARERLAPFGDRVHLVHAVYDAVPEALASLEIESASGILFDLGVSSLQLDRVDRGFSYSQDAPLDMRMDATSELTAERILAEYSEFELRRIFFEYGEEKLAPRYARKIVQAREISPLSRSGQLVDLIIAATPAAARRAGHPAKRVFQALRMSVLARAIPASIDLLAIGGRMVVLSYQSLEDRIVKRAFASASSSTAPAGLPVELPEHQPKLRLLVRGAELATEAEKLANPRATPVRLRAVERVLAAA
jgi:16S rRNA (cytosine1402-N4)-methyltransferase